MTNQVTMNPLAARLAALLTIACLIPAANTTRASGNLLLNGDFELPGNGNAASDWVLWTWGQGWANTEVPAWGSGSWQVSVGAPGNGGGGLYQIIAGAAGVEYTLTVSSGADAWWLPTGRMEMFFLDSTNGVISTATRLTVDPDVYGMTNDIPHPWSNYTLVATAPAGTKFIKVEFSCNESLATPGNASGSVGFDDASLTAPVEPPVISDVRPDGLLMATNTLSFTAHSLVPIDSSGIEVLVNGVDVSSSLAVTGSGTTNVSVSYVGLQVNQLYTAAITVADTANLSAFTAVNFDTYAPSFTWEAEDYDYGSRQYINNPIPSDTAAAGSYFGRTGYEGVDFHEQNGNGNHDYRAGDAMATAVVGDPLRQAFIDAGASDYNVGWFDGAGFGGDNVGIASYDPGDWVNYTRDFPAGTYNLYARLANGNGGTATIPLSKVTGGWGTTSQTTEELGVFRFPAVGWGSYAYVPLTDRFGNKLAVALSGVQTLRVTAGSGGNLNFFMLMPVDTDQPLITDVYPDGRTLLQGTNKLSFTVSSVSHSIAQSNVVLTLNGVDVSASQSFSGSSSSWDVSAPLSANVTSYTAVISVTDDVGNDHSITVYFDTFAPDSFVIEAEDFDFDGGQFIDNPVITSNAAPNSYFGKIGQTEVDSSVGVEAPPTTADFRYRDLDDMATSTCTDTPMRKNVQARLTNSLAFNYNVGWWSSNAWLNFSRTYPTGDFNVYARLAGGNGESYSVSFDELNGTLNHLGTFVGVGRGYNAFDWIPLVNTNTSQKVVVTLGGVTTLRATTAIGSVNPNNFIFVPAATAPEELQWSYDGGVLRLNWSNPALHLQFQAHAPGAGLGTGWSDYPGGGASPVNVTNDLSAGSLLFRLSD